MLSHLDENDSPHMVNVGDKPVTKREARAQCRVALPENIATLFASGEWNSKKGPVIQTAVLAGIMAAKKTSELIPLCHPIALEDCTVTIARAGDRDLVIECRVAATHKTGVEMEALTGASVAALTIYDMCKALSHDIVIQDTRLIEKHGGKSDYVLRQK